MKTKEWIAAGLITAFFLICKFVITEPVQFSRTVSIVIMILMGLLFVGIMIATLKGKYIGRRIVFLLVGISLILPFFMQFSLPLQISPEVQSAFDALDGLPPGAKVLCSYDYDPPSAPELQPMSDAIIQYAFEKDLKIIIMGLWPQGPQQANQSIEMAFTNNPDLREQRVYGVDYVNLGFQAGNEFVILRMGESFKAMFPRDIYNTSYDSIPLVKNIRNFSNIDFSFNFSAGKPGTVEWVQIAVDRYNLTMAAANTAVQAPMVYPYLKSGQLVGILGGMSGAAEMEKLTQKIGKATTFLLSQSFAHMVVIAFILIGNVAYFRERKEKS
ncbi:MAG: hypothetical protein GY841_10600 [FCB group bacterium]|nr:hypothetical protein [FCB group bacterium]